jgi:hypothetical protein
LIVENDHQRKGRFDGGNYVYRCNITDTSEKMAEHMGNYSIPCQQSNEEAVYELSHVMCSLGVTGVYQLTLTTLSYSSKVLIGIGI